MKQVITFFEINPLKRFYPLTLTRPVFDLRTGILTLGEKWMYDLGAMNGDSRNPAGVLRPGHKGLFLDASNDKFRGEHVSGDEQTIVPTLHHLWINPACLPNKQLVRQISNMATGSGILLNDELVAASVPPSVHRKWLHDGQRVNDLDTILPISAKPVLVKTPWDLLHCNGSEIVEDLQRIQPLFCYSPQEDHLPEEQHSPQEKSAPQELHSPQDQHSLKDQHSSQDLSSTIPTKRTTIPNIFGTHPVYTEEGVIIEPGVHFITTKGPVYLGKNSHIMAGSQIRGPVAIGASSTLKMGAKIYEYTSIGPVCKVGGEVSGSIFHSFSNKGHDGFVGDSVLGQWCNLGADTNTSNLKNNYGTVRITHPLTGEKTDTGRQFLGTIMGDHTKTGINAMLNTGTLCGVSCNFIAGSYHPVSAPSFSWITDEGISEYRFDKAIETMQRMMSRRNVNLSKEYRSMMKAIFDAEKGENK